MWAKHAAWRSLAYVAIWLFVSSAVPLTASAQGGSSYVVQAGDSLGYIAATYGTTVDAIMQANGLASADTIWPGQTLTIPVQATGPAGSEAGGPSSGSTYTVKLGDTLASIAGSLGVSGAALAQANGLTDPDLLWVGQRLLVPGTALGSTDAAQPPSSVDGNRYTVQPGDTLNSIARGLGVSTADLMQANNLNDADLLLVGQKLIVPNGGQAAVVGRAPTPVPMPIPAPAPIPTVTASAVMTASTAAITRMAMPLGYTLFGKTLVPARTANAATATPASSQVPVASPVSPTPPATMYVVAPGDTLNSIAARLGVSTVDLMQANSLGNADLLQIGQSLIVPTATPEPTVTPSAGPVATSMPADQGTVTPAASGTLATVGAGITTTAASETPAAPGQLTATPTVSATVPPWAQQQIGQLQYIVKPGDTLGSIAQQYTTTAAAIARASHLSSPDLVSVGTTLFVPSPAWTSPNLGGTPSRFVASISQQRCWLYRGNEIVANWPCSTGRPGTDTHPGSYRIQSKMEKAFGSTWNIWMPYWLGIYWAGASENGIHGIPYNADTGWKLWEGFVGTPITYGCVLLDQEHAKQLYDLAYIGMPVIIQP